MRLSYVPDVFFLLLFLGMAHPGESRLQLLPLVQKTRKSVSSFFSSHELDLLYSSSLPSLERYNLVKMLLPSYFDTHCMGMMLGLNSVQLFEPKYYNKSTY